MAVSGRMGATESASTRREAWLKAFRLSASANLVMAVAALAAVLMAWHAFSSRPEPRQFAASEDGGIVPPAAVPLPFPKNGQIANFAVEAANRALTMDFKNRRGDPEEASVRYYRPECCTGVLSATERSSGPDFVRERRLDSSVFASETAILVELAEGRNCGGRPNGSFRVAPDAGEKVAEFDAITLPDGRTLKISAFALDVAVAETVGASDVERRILRRLVPIPISPYVFAFADPVTAPRTDSRHPGRGHEFRRTFGRRKRSPPRKNWHHFRGSRKRLGRTRAGESKDRPESGPGNSDAIRDFCLPGDPSLPSSSEIADDAPNRGTAMTMTTRNEIGSAANAGANIRTARERSAEASKPKRASSSDPKSAPPKPKKPRTVTANGEGAKSRASRSSLPNAVDSNAMRSKPSASHERHADANRSRSSSSDCGLMTGRVHPPAAKGENGMSMRSKPFASNEGNATTMRSAHAAPNEGDADAKPPRDSSSNCGGMKERTRFPASIWDDSPTDPSRSDFSEDRQPARPRIPELLKRLEHLNDAPGPMDASFWYTYDPKAVGSASGDADGTHAEDSRTARATAHSRAVTGSVASERGDGTRVAPDAGLGRMPEIRRAGGEPRNEGGFVGEEADRFDIRGDSKSAIEEFGPPWPAPSSMTRSMRLGVPPAAPGSAVSPGLVKARENGEAGPNSAFRPRVPDAGPNSASNPAPEGYRATRYVSGEDRNIGSAVRTQVDEFDERDDAETIYAEHDSSPPMPLAGGMGPGKHPEAPIRADSFGRELASGSRDIDSSVGYGTSFPDPESEADRVARLEGPSEPRSAADVRNDADAVRERNNDFNDRVTAEILHEKPDSTPTAPLPINMESGISAAVRSDAESRSMEEPDVHDGEMPHAEPVARELARHANQSVRIRRTGEGVHSPDGHGTFPDEYPAPAGMLDDRRARDEGEAISGTNAAVDDFDAMFDGGRRIRPARNRTESDMRESANSPEIALSEAHQGHADPNRERARFAQKRMLFGWSGNWWASFFSAVVLAGALGYAMGGPNGPFPKRRVVEFAAYPDSPTTPTEGETGTFAAAENQKEDSPGTDTTLLSELPGIAESYAPVGVETPVSGHDSAGRYALSESSGLPESSVQPKISNSFGITDPSAVSGTVGQPDPDDPSGMNERSPGDVDTAGSEYQGKAADQLGNESDPLAANAIPNRPEPSDGPVGAEPSSGATSGLYTTGRRQEFDASSSANGVPYGNIPGEAPRPNSAESIAPVRETRMEDLEGDMERLEVQLAEAMERASLLEARVEVNERSLLELSSLLATIPKIIQSIEETQVVLLDIANRVEINETAYGDDMAEFSRTLAGIDESVNKLTANFAVVSRIALKALGEAGNGGIPGDAAFQSDRRSLPMPENGATHFDANEHGNGDEVFDATPPIGSVPADVSIGDFLEGYGYVLAIRNGEDGEKLVIMERGAAVVSE